jgi:hypothetical protein
MAYSFPEKTINGLEEWKSRRRMTSRFGFLMLGSFVGAFIFIILFVWIFKLEYNPQGVLEIIIFMGLMSIIVGGICVYYIFKADEYAHLPLEFKGMDTVKSTEDAIKKAFSNKKIAILMPDTTKLSELVGYIRFYEPENKDWKVKNQFEYGHGGTSLFYIRVGPINDNNQFTIIDFMKELSITLKAA